MGIMVNILGKPLLFPPFLGPPLSDPPLFDPPLPDPSFPGPPFPFPLPAVGSGVGAGGVVCSGCVGEEVRAGVKVEELVTSTVVCKVVVSSCVG